MASWIECELMSKLKSQKWLQQIKPRHVRKKGTDSILAVTLTNLDNYS